MDLALALAQGHAVKSWALAHGVPECTAYRWAADPEVRAEIESWRRRAIDRAVGSMARRANWAANQITELAKTAASESVKLSALRAILADMMSISEYSGLEERMARIEEQLSEQPANADCAG